MTILVAGWTSVWTEQTAKLIKASSSCAELVLVHSKNCQKPMSLFTKCVMRETGEVRIFVEEIQYGSLTRGVFEHLCDEQAFDLFVLSADFGFRPVSECIRAIRFFSRYRLTPVLIQSIGAPNELSGAERLGITATFLEDDISPIIRTLNSLDHSQEIQS